MSGLFEPGFALLVGVNESEIPSYALPDVLKDISALEKVLTHPARCAYPPAQVKVITGNAATKQNLLDGLAWLGAQLALRGQDDATVLVYYSGHGVRDTSVWPPAYYLIPYETKAGDLPGTALPANEFLAALDRFDPRRLLVILDCCHASGMAEQTGGKALAPEKDGLEVAPAPVALFMSGGPAGAMASSAKGLDALAQGAGRAVLSSSQREQRSYLRRDRAMSIFTYHLIEALMGHAQPAEGATEVLVSDIMSHVWRHVPKSSMAHWGVEQQPDYQVSGNFPVALILGGKGLAGEQRAPDPLTTVGAAKQPRRSKVTHGDEVRGDKISVGTISGNATVAIGRKARAGESDG